MSKKIPSPLTLDLTDTRAFKTWLYQLWQATGGTTDTAQDIVDSYVSPDFLDQSAINKSFDSVLLLQITQELAEITKRLDEIELNRVVSEKVTIESNYPELQTEELSKRLDEIYLFLGNPK